MFLGNGLVGRQLHDVAINKLPYFVCSHSLLFTRPKRDVQAPGLGGRIRTCVSAMRRHYPFEGHHLTGHWILRICPMKTSGLRLSIPPRARLETEHSVSSWRCEHQTSSLWGLWLAFRMWLYYTKCFKSYFWCAKRITTDWSLDLQLRKQRNRIGEGNSHVFIKLCIEMKKTY